MCGICGVVAAEREGAPDLEAVARMSGRLVHRGPDDDGLFHEGPVALAARRLSIIDLDHGHQPIENDVGSAVVVQNGEIYLYRELKR
jgi:asparagine synthase (glutamine-hydrolysing)